MLARDACSLAPLAHASNLGRFSIVAASIFVAASRRGGVSVGARLWWWATWWPVVATAAAVSSAASVAVPIAISLAWSIVVAPRPTIAAVIESVAVPTTAVVTAIEAAVLLMVSIQEESSD